MMDQSYRPNGWLGMLLGVRLWYGFYGAVLATAEAFEHKMEELCRELGDRARRTVTDGTSSGDTQLDGVKRGHVTVSCAAGYPDLENVFF
eukprot:COSAG05_NODE_2715_length_2733_cov_19.057327_3_plen_90_part_00